MLGSDGSSWEGSIGGKGGNGAIRMTRWNDYLDVRICALLRYMGD